MRRTRPLALMILAFTLLAGCGPKGEPAAAADDVSVTAGPPVSAYVADYIPEGFTINGIQRAEAQKYQRPLGLLIGDPKSANPLAGPVVLVGSSGGSASMAGPDVIPGTSVDVPELSKEHDWMTPSLTKDGPWTWLQFPNGCPTDCIYYVVGRDVADEDLIQIAKSATFDSERPEVAVAAIPEGLAPLVEGEGGDDISAAASFRLQYEGPEFTGLTVEVVEADPVLARLWAFWLDGGEQIEIGGTVGWSGKVGATIGSRDRQAMVWAEDGVVFAVSGSTSAANLRKVAESVRSATSAELASLEQILIDAPPTWSDAGCLEPDGVILSQRVGNDRWSVCFDQASPGDYAMTVGWFTPAGQEPGSSSSFDLAAGGKISFSTSGVCGSEPGAPRSGTFVAGSVPPTTVAVDVTIKGMASGSVELADTGPRSGERWFAAYVPDDCAGGQNEVSITAKDAGGAVVATV